MAFNPITALFGTKHERDLKALLPILHSVNAKESWALALGDADFPRLTAEFRSRLEAGETLDGILPEAFALAREAARRALGERPFDVQILGGIVLHQGKIVEMKTGEGKTLMSVAPIYLNSLSGKGVHVVTVNDYLAERDSAWMGKVFSFLGASVGVVLSRMEGEARREAYRKDITYATNNELGFDYLRDNMAWSVESRVQRGHAFCVVDEIDSILIDEARTPLIISGPAEDDTYRVSEVDRLAVQLVEVAKNPATGEYPREELGEEMVGDFKIDEKSKRVSFTPAGLDRMEELLRKRGLMEGSLFDEGNFQFVHYFSNAVRAHRLFERETEYVVQDGMVQIVDEFTGRILHGRRYSDGLHEAIEAKERIKVARRNRTLATITFQNYFRLYGKIGGMTGTADTEAPEFLKIYELDVVVIPTNRPVMRKDEDDLVYLNEAEKFEAICDEIAEVNKAGQPILVGTVSIDKSERLSALLTRRGIRHEVLNAKNHAREAAIIAEAGAKGAVTIATNMAGRGTDIKLGGNLEFRARRKAGSEATDEQLRAAMAEEFEAWRKDYDEVRSLGGLYVLGTERHESRRIDNQLRGRSGRQGDPGASCFFVSFDDDLMRLYGGENLKGLMMRVGMKPGEPIYHPMLSRTLEGAQRRVEERNFEIRKHLLEYDDVLNQQRKYIYEQRDEILRDQDLVARVMASARAMVDELLETYGEAARNDRTAAWAALRESLREEFNVALPFTLESPELAKVEALREAAYAALEANIDEKVAYAGAANLGNFIRYQYLQSIDQKWLDHLENMEGLREAVHLRHYAQKNPLLEYKLEGFQIFETMIDEIRTGLARRVFLVRIGAAEERRGVRPAPAAVAEHREFGQFGGVKVQSTSTSSSRAAPAAPRPAAAPHGSLADQARAANVTVERHGPKVGRNDPCPCGSGKKYKHCHGA